MTVSLNNVILIEANYELVIKLNPFDENKLAQLVHHIHLNKFNTV